MEVANIVITATVMAAIALIVTWLGKGRLDAMDRRIERFEDRVEHRFDTLQASVDAMRSDLTQVALAVGVNGRASNA